MGYYEDSGAAARDKKPKKTALVGKTNDKQKKYYRDQRIKAEAGEKKGNVAATRTAAKIHGKTGKGMTAAEGDLALKPGASEGEQMGNVAMAGGMMGDMGGIVARGIGRVMEDVASHQALSGSRMALPSGEARSTLGPAMKRLKLGAGKSTRGEMTQARPRPVEPRTGGPNKLSGTKQKALPKPKTTAKTVARPKTSTAKPKTAKARAKPKTKNTVGAP